MDMIESMKLFFAAMAVFSAAIGLACLKGTLMAYSARLSRRLLEQGGKKHV